MYHWQWRIPWSAASACVRVWTGWVNCPVYELASLALYLGGGSQEEELQVLRSELSCQVTNANPSWPLEKNTNYAGFGGRAGAGPGGAIL